jgi:hypothetical protein
MLANFVFANKIVCYQPHSNMETLNQNAIEQLITEKLEKYLLHYRFILHQRSKNNF